jgi:hypothetical protein
MEELRKQLKREVTPEDVLRDVEENRKSPFRGWFTWDVEKGYRKNLLAEARQLVAQLKVIYTDPDTGEAVSVRRYVRLLVSRPDHTFHAGYVARPKAMSTSYLHDQVVQLAKSHLEQFITRFRSFSRIEPTFPIIQRAIGLLEAALEAKERKAE